MAKPPYPQGSAASLYEARTPLRQPFLTRAYEAAKLTLPSIMPENGANGGTTLHSPFQSVGSRGVKNLGAKLLLALMPPNAPFFRLSVDETAMKQITGDDQKKKTLINETLNSMERTVQTHIEQTSTRVTVSEGLLHLLIAGNGLLYIPEDGNTRLFPLSQYVIIRDPSGTVLNIITKEEISKEVLTEKQKALLQANKPEDNPTSTGQDTVCLYTQIKRENGRWNTHQELDGIRDKDSEGFYPLEASAYIPMRFRKIDGQDYGRGFIEENIGDLKSLEGLSQSLVEAAAGLAKLLVLVDPNGVTSKKTISHSPNMSVRDGRAADVTFLRSDKQPDLNWAGMQAERIEKRLELSFLLNSAVQRQAERVTAEEVRYVAMELEDGLGGIYSILTLEVQMPMTNRFITVLQKTNKLPVLPKNVVKPQIITGLEALGRGHDLNRIDTFTNGVKELVGPENLDMYMKVSEVLKARAIAVGIDITMLRTEEEAAEIQKNRQMSAMTEKLGPNAITQMGSAVRESQQAAAPQATQ